MHHFAHLQYSIWVLNQNKLYHYPKLRKEDFPPIQQTSKHYKHLNKSYNYQALLVLANGIPVLTIRIYF